MTRERVEFTRRQWLDLGLLIVLMAILISLELTAGIGWWTPVLLILQFIMLVRIALWIIPIWQNRR